MSTIYKLAPTYNTDINALFVNIIVRSLESDWTTHVDPVMLAAKAVGVTQTKFTAGTTDQPISVIDAEYALSLQNLKDYGYDNLIEALNLPVSFITLALKKHGTDIAISYPVQVAVPLWADIRANLFTFNGINPKVSPSATDLIPLLTLYPQQPLSEEGGIYASVVLSFYTKDQISPRTAAVGYVGLHPDGNFIYCPTGEQFVNSLNVAQAPTMWVLTRPAMAMIVEHPERVIPVLTVAIRLYGKSSIGASLLNLDYNSQSLGNIRALLNQDLVDDRVLNQAFAQLGLFSE